MTQEQDNQDCLTAGAGDPEKRKVASDGLSAGYYNREKGEWTT